PVFRLGEKPDVRGKTFAFFGAFAKEGRPRGRNTEVSAHTEATQKPPSQGSALQHPSKKRRPCRRITGMARSYR
ncbi:hypothetical protein ACNFIA_23310, partial [Pseudomonas sp. NY15437]|uniref:hypothetical protein n=1 Tax=Pseudomonas sp. NY15437 TaxID=3400360 RepID=UPI003A8AB227